MKVFFAPTLLILSCVASEKAWSGATFSASGVVFEDPNGNGQPDPGEPLLPNVEIHLLHAGASAATVLITKTDGTGNFKFAKIKEGDYRLGLAQRLPSGHVRTTDNSKIFKIGGKDLIYNFGIQSSEAGVRVRKQDFSSDPAWVGFRNRMPQTCLTITQDFGYNPTERAIGGLWQQSTQRAHYGLPFPKETGWGSAMSIQGTIKIAAKNGLGAYIGFFSREHTASTRPRDHIGIRIQENVSHMDESGTKHYPVDIVGLNHYYEAEGVSSVLTIPADGRYHEFRMRLYPDNRLFVQIDGKEATYKYSRISQKEIKIDRFGIHQMGSGASKKSLELYFDDISASWKTGRDSFDRKPTDWVGQGNQRVFQDCIMRPNQNFGYNAKTGNIGGNLWRGGGLKPGVSFYADEKVLVGFDKPISMSGTIQFAQGFTDAGMYFGYFNKKLALEGNASMEGGLLGIIIGGATRDGFNFTTLATNTPTLQSNGKFSPLKIQCTGKNASASGKSKVCLSDNVPVIIPTGQKIRFTWDYDPATRKVSWTLSPQTAGGLKVPMQKFEIQLPASIYESGIIFDHFGIITVGGDGKRVDVFLDDLEYVVRH